jgi:excisionase family DNA binding protein
MVSTEQSQSSAELIKTPALPITIGRIAKPPPMTTRTTNRDGTQLAFTSSQAASYLGVSLATVRRWTNDGHLHGYRTPGGQRRFSREQLDQFLSSLTSADDTTSAA